MQPLSTTSISRNHRPGASAAGRFVSTAGAVRSDMCGACLAIPHGFLAEMLECPAQADGRLLRVSPGVAATWAKATEVCKLATGDSSKCSMSCKPSTAWREVSDDRPDNRLWCVMDSHAVRLS
jgi:hypothetical protein